MPTLPHLLERNRQWVRRTVAEEPEFFLRLARQQKPKYLWIGCSDSRVPANQIIDLAPGEVFVHRNVGNLVVHTDLNMLSVLQFAVELLDVEHVMVVGHYGCGCIDAALAGKPLGLVDQWLRHVQDLADLHRPELDPLSPAARSDRLCELNVLAQAENLSRTSILQEAWARGRAVEVHSWIYRLDDGSLRPLRDVITAPLRSA